MNTPIADLREAGSALGREGISMLVKARVAECDGSYKNLMQLCGELSVIAKMATCDDYWSEQVNRGVDRAECIVERALTLLKALNEEETA